MRTIFFIAISVSILMFVTDTAKTVRTISSEPPTEAFTLLSEPPPRALENWKTNSYVLLLGIAADPMLDPTTTGYEMWVEVESDRGHRFFDYGTGPRTRLRIPEQVVPALAVWAGQDPLAEFRQQEALLRQAITEYGVMMIRYRLWLAMPFEDWGYGHPGTPRLVELVAAHRLYVAEGFAQGITKGLDRLQEDLSAWRTVLARAKTLPIKLAAAIVVEEDAALLAALLTRTDLDTMSLVRASHLARPLNADERSLRWPIQHEFMLEVHRHDGISVKGEESRQDESSRNKEWIATLAGLKPDAVKMVEHPVSGRSLAKAPHKQRVLNVYASYYEAVIKAVEAPNSTLPNLRDVARAAPQSFVDSLLTPKDSMAGGPEPAWNAISDRILETDARLRLAGLQAAMRRPSRTQYLPSRIGRAGLRFFDPFTGLPMLWSRTQKKLYSVGKDRLDDGGESSFDITVPVVLAENPAPPVKEHSVVKVSRTTRKR